MTSATLSVGKDDTFRYFRSRVGLIQSENRRLGSPFDYQRQAKVVVVRGMPDPAEEKEQFAQRTALGRWGDPDELAGPVLMLATEAGSYITGATLVVDGGVLCRIF